MFGYELTWMQLAWLFEILFILSIVYAIREILLERIYGARFKRWIEIDTGRHGYVILDKTLTNCRILGQTRTVNRANIEKGFMYFVLDCTENLKLEDAKEKWQYYCNSDEFDTVFKNQLLRQLMYVLEKNYILIILVLVIVGIAISGYNIYLQRQQQQVIEWIAWKVNQTYVPAGTGIAIQ